MTLSALVPAGAALVVGCWVLVEQVRRLRERKVRVSLQPEYARLHAAYLEEASQNPPVDYDGVNSRARRDYERLVELSGVSPRRARRSPSFTDVNVDLEMGPTLPVSEIARQAILLGGAVAGVVLLAAAELSHGM